MKEKEYKIIYIILSLVINLKICLDYYPQFHLHGSDIGHLIDVEKMFQITIYAILFTVFARICLFIVLNFF